MTSVRDALGQGFDAPASYGRIVSLVPSLTEALFAFGAGARVVGVTRFCCEPMEARSRTIVGGTKNPEIGGIVSLRPDLVIASIEENRREDVEALQSAGLRVFVTLVNSVEAARDLLADLAALCGVELAARPYLDAIDESMEALHAARPRDPARVFCPIWRRPYMSVGSDTYAGDVISLAGGTNVFANLPGRYPIVSLDNIVAADPEVILLPDEPYPFAAKHRAELAALPITAARSGRIHLCDGKDMTWYWSRTGESLQHVAALISGRVPAEV